MRADTRAAVVVGVLSLVRSALVGGVVVTFLALSGAVGWRTTAALGAAVVVGAALLGTGVAVLSRRPR